MIKMPVLAVVSALYCLFFFAPNISIFIFLIFTNKWYVRSTFQPAKHYGDVSYSLVFHCFLWPMKKWNLFFFDFLWHYRHFGFHYWRQWWLLRSCPVQPFLIYTLKVSSSEFKWLSPPISSIQYLSAETIRIVSFSNSIFLWFSLMKPYSMVDLIFHISFCCSTHIIYLK